MTTISKDKQYRTRDGREVRIYATDGRERRPVHGAINSHDGWAFNTWTKDGFGYRPGDGTCLDLIEVKPRFRRERWANVYSDPSDSSYLYKTRAEALQFAADNRIATKRIIIEGTEGEDDE